ncbi:hypothetical protein [Butyrivibrio proteoclasticus]|uniref:hypothetical protein n=1 Tax=Butyrivibrio proteoclasticus TaxID=43305 RepID=UPI00047C0C6F|nr:hypothetical protein [Butyrivibrio proteoclasticus]
MEKGIKFELKPNNYAITYSVIFFVGAVASFFLLLDFILGITRENKIDEIIIVSLILGASSLFCLVYGISMLTPIVNVCGDIITIKHLKRIETINVHEIEYIESETRYRIGRVSHLMLIRSQKRGLSLQDTFITNYEVFVEYLKANVDSEKCKIVIS